MNVKNRGKRVISGLESLISAAVAESRNDTANTRDHSNKNSGLRMGKKKARCSDIPMMATKTAVVPRQKWKILLLLAKSRRNIVAA